jgi:catechol 2,3-dioxygenase-like lactoylglutathione lyase family enzyme
MPILRMDHFTILATDTERTVAFYIELLGLEPGPRPAFAFPGAWLYSEGEAVLHVIERSAIPEGCGVLDHVAFWGEDLPSLLARLDARDLSYDLRRLPEGGHAAGVWQVFFIDPNGACIEIDFAATETTDGGKGARAIQ